MRSPLQNIHGETRSFTSLFADDIASVQAISLHHKWPGHQLTGFLASSGKNVGNQLAHIQVYSPYGEASNICKLAITLCTLLLAHIQIRGPR